jgi:dolichyl-diphosphooligosaccharide--protein glycosyltransferase
MMKIWETFKYVSPALLLLLFLGLTASGSTKFGGRTMSLLDPTYAAQFMPLVASVSEHSPSPWGSYFGNFH